MSAARHRRFTCALAVVLGMTSGVAAAESLADAWGLAQQYDHSLAAARSHAEAAGLYAQAARG